MAARRAMLVIQAVLVLCAQRLLMNVHGVAFDSNYALLI